MVGAATPTGFVLRVKTTGTFARAVVALDVGLTSPITTPDFTPTGEGIATVAVTDLDPDTRYHYAIEDSDGQDTTFPGQVRTLPPAGAPASFTIGAASCAGSTPDVEGEGAVLAPSRLSNSTIFDTIRVRALAEDWRAWIGMGDWHYYDLGSDKHGIVGASITEYRRAWDDVLLQSRQHELYRSVNTVAMYDDHDFGPDNSDRTSPGRDNAVAAWQERTPHYLRGSGDPLGANYHSFQIGRILFVVLDCRANRDPNSDADTPSKQMLGVEQETWLSNTLFASTAQALVLVSTAQWEHPTGVDTWASFTHARQRVIDILGAPGGDASRSWLPRMWLVQGDAHSTGIRRENLYGGFPVAQFAALDASPSGAQSWKDLAVSSQRGQYGTLSVADVGSSITITATAYTFSTALGSYSHVITLDEEPGPDPEPPIILPPPTEARKRTSVTWLACNAVNGTVIDELPDLTGSFGRVLCEHTSTNLTTPIGSPGRNIDQIVAATHPGRTMIVPIVNDIPAGAGWILPRELGTDPYCQLGVVSLEGYWLRRTINDHNFVDQDIGSVIAGSLIADGESKDGIGQGMGFLVDAVPTGVIASREYFAKSRKHIFPALDELSMSPGGPEFTVDVEWSDTSQTRIDKIARLKPRIGAQADLPVIFEVTANSIFESKSSAEARYKYLEDWSSGKAGNWMRAYSSGQGEDQPESQPVIDLAALADGWPIIEHYFQPGTDITDPLILDGHAQAEYDRIHAGTTIWRLTTRWDAYPMLGVDWYLGDDVAWVVKGSGHPTGVMGQGRVIGWTLDLQKSEVELVLEGSNGSI
jgi:hypothetical protein